MTWTWLCKFLTGFMTIYLRWKRNKKRNRSESSSRVTGCAWRCLKRWGFPLISGANFSEFEIWDANLPHILYPSRFLSPRGFYQYFKALLHFFFLAITGPAPSQKHGVTKEPLAHHPNRILNAFDCLISHKINCYLNYLEVFFLSLALCIKKDHLCFNRNFKAIFK